jgi:hypothetical protein
MLPMIVGIILAQDNLVHNSCALTRFCPYRKPSA